MKDQAKIPRSLLLKLATVDYKHRKKVQLRNLRWMWFFWLLGFIAGYSLAMILVTDDFFWHPFKKYS